MYHQQDHVLFLLFYGVWVTDRLKRILSDGVLEFGAISGSDRTMGRQGRWAGHLFQGNI